MESLMEKHEKAAIVDHLIGIFMNIKTLSCSARVMDLCSDGVKKLYKLSEAEKIQKELDEVRARRIDPTN